MLSVHSVQLKKTFAILQVCSCCNFLPNTAKLTLMTFFSKIRFSLRLYLGLSHLREHKFKHSFQDTLNPICLCGDDVESTSHFLLYCPSFNNERCILLNTLNQIDGNLLNKTDTLLVESLLYGSKSMNCSNNTRILNATITFILSTNRFEEAFL